MLHKLLEQTLGHLTESELKEVLELATADIKTNRLSFRKKTGKYRATVIAVACYDSRFREIKKAAS